MLYYFYTTLNPFRLNYMQELYWNSTNSSRY
jgi:hypothetical protein